MIKIIYRSLLANLLLIVVLCGVYPMVVTAFGQIFFKDKANGSLVFSKEGKIVGSRLIGQGFSQAGYFHPRPSAAGDKGYDAANSAASNYGPTQQKLHDALKNNIEAFLKENPSVKRGEIPNDIVTTSASGLDPHISPGSAYAQLARVAQNRKIEESKLRALIDAHIQGPQLGILGESVVNVLELNLALDDLAGVQSP